VRKQRHFNILHVYECPRGRGWHVGHDYEAVEAEAITARNPPGPAS
jgi:hypothetical protein